MPRSIAARLLVGGLVGGMALAGCGGTAEGDGTPEKFCATLTESQGTIAEAQQQIRAITDAGNNIRGVGDALGVTATFIDITRVIDNLASAAPPEITGDIQALKDAADKVAFPASMTPQGVYTEAVQAKQQLEDGGHLQRIETYTRQQCGTELQLF